MTTHAFLKHMEMYILLPVLAADGADYTNRKRKLAKVQAAVIDVLREVYYPCRGQDDMLRIFIQTFNKPAMNALWYELNELGFATPLDKDVQQILICLAMDDDDTLSEPLSYAYSTGEFRNTA